MSARSSSSSSSGAPAGGGTWASEARFLQAEGVGFTKSGVRSILGTGRTSARCVSRTAARAIRRSSRTTTRRSSPSGSGKRYRSTRVHPPQRPPRRPRSAASSTARRAGGGCKIGSVRPARQAQARPTPARTREVHGARRACAGEQARRLRGRSCSSRPSAEHEPHVEAVLLGDSRYTDALSRRRSRRAGTLRSSGTASSFSASSVSRGFAQGLKVRKDALELARRELAKILRPAAKNRKSKAGRYDYLRGRTSRLYERERYSQYIEKVWLKPAGRVGSRVPPVEVVRRRLLRRRRPDPPAAPPGQQVAARHQAHLQRERERLARERPPKARPPPSETS